jgi:nucleoside-diphosphate-sugar epimerase
MPSSSQRVLYFGGTGEISASCAEASLAAGHDVTVFNRGRSDQPLPAGARQITGDVTNPADLADLADRRFDVVCQFLAYQPEQLERDLDAFAGQCGQYVFLSSASCYRKPLTETIITEDVPLENPYWPYSQRKIEMERRLLAAHHEGTIPATIVRPSHTFRTKFPGGLAAGDEWAWRLRNEKPVIVHGDGLSLWTYTHSDDFATPFANLLGNPRSLGQALHITRHLEAFTWDAIYSAVARALGVEPRLVHVPTETLARYNPDWRGPLMGDKAWSAVYDNTKAFDLAGHFTCEVGLDEGLTHAAKFVTRRLETHRPDPDLHALLDRIAENQQALGTRPTP